MQIIPLSPLSVAEATFSGRSPRGSCESEILKRLPRKAVFFIKTKSMWIVYILKCSDKTYYVGCTANMDERLVRHNRGEVQYTSSRLPFEIAYQSVFFDKYKAFEFEKYLKSGSGRAFAKKRLYSF